MMQESRLELTAIRDLKPGMKNLNMIFIVLEIGIELVNLGLAIYVCFANLFLI